MRCFIGHLLLIFGAICGHSTNNQCDPLLSWRHDDDSGDFFDQKLCLLPLPNDFHTIVDHSTPTGRRIRLRTSPAPGVDIEQWQFRDGWSPSSSILISGLTESIRMPFRGVQFDCQSRACASDYHAWKKNSGEPWFSSHLNIAGLDGDKRLLMESAVLILDTVTGDPVAHWVELDKSSDFRLINRPFSPYAFTSHISEDQFIFGGVDTKDTSIPAEPQTLIVHPAMQLEHGRRYIVALKNLRSAKRRDWFGRPLKIAANPGFVAIRDDIHRDNASEIYFRGLHFKRNRIIDQLIESGFVRDRKELILAWDFTTSSLITSTEHLRFMRDDGIRRLREDAKFSYRVHRSIDFLENVNPLIARKVEGTFLAPIYLKTTAPSLKSRFEFDCGPRDNFASCLQPRFQGLSNVSFTIWIPRSLLSKNTGSILLYGHGLFMTRQEGGDMYLQRFAYENNYVIVSVDWWGLQLVDLPVLSSMLMTDIARFRGLGERCSQAILNFLLITKLLRHSKIIENEHVFSINGSQILELRRSDSDGMLEPANIFFCGNSLGGIFGTTVMALSQDIKVANLGVPGGPFELLFARNPSGALVINKFMKRRFSYSAQRLAVILLLFQFWELADPSGYVAILRNGKILGNEPGTTIVDPRLGRKKILFQLVLGDGLVNRVAGLYLVRSLNGHTYPNDPCEMAYILPRNSQVRRTKVDPNNCDQLPLINGNNFTGSNVVSSFKFEIIPNIVPFANIPPSLTDGRLRYNSHEWLRAAKVAQHQTIKFFAEYIRQNRLGGFNDDQAWVERPCGANGGCWNVTLPK